ncbi:low affinity iron permease family protein [Pseudomonas typographi]|uniref:Low affinity iron permease family protein n=1 Tax=Pseudomonas typographi TaxID=2715964 RepID=A0ABR7Z3U1_9PSED|nr:low affinity iron permease family protein [Pseudomonas typographi]MBD1552702.1 low affinity iron permease family protein [Pseudomonas typographi]MBD1588183.1 low affinity iron permease family protein [Pseudomonas typographi]MBD1600154.1 low affinity iron permease family protein [Pseudomonas typographi]
MTFENVSQALAKKAGSSKTFAVAVVLIILWALSGPWFHYNDTWQLIINTSTTIITFLMVFVIQNTQNRDNDVLHIKIDELLRATKEAHMAVVNLDEKDAHELKLIRKHYKQLGDGQEIEVAHDETTLKDVPAATPKQPPA